MTLWLICDCALTVTRSRGRALTGHPLTDCALTSRALTVINQKQSLFCIMIEYCTMYIYHKAVLYV